MLFSVIYSADVPEGVNVEDYAPPPTTGVWGQTGAGPTEYAYLEGRWESGLHRQWSGLLTRDQFDAFVGKLGLIAEDVQTMGSLGAPGFGFGWAPAISFHGDGEDAILNAYVTPVPEIQKDGFDERDWRRVQEAVLKVYGRRRNRAA